MLIILEMAAKKILKNSTAMKDVAYELHTPVRRKYPRRHTSVRSFRDLFCSDVIDMQSYAEENNGYRFILIVICAFCKYLFARKLMSKNMGDMAEAMNSILGSKEKAFIKPPRLMLTDRGPEYYNSEVNKI